MAEVIELALRDPRIPKLVNDRVGDGPFAVYLLDAIRANYGTVTVVRLVLGALEDHLAHAGSVDAKDVKFLSVHLEGDDRIAEISRGLLASIPDLADRFHQLYLSFKYDPFSIPKGAKRFPLVGVRPRHGVSHDELDLTHYMRIYLCALAMLAGVTVDPRGKIDTHATG